LGLRLDIPGQHDGQHSLSDPQRVQVGRGDREGRPGDGRVALVLVAELGADAFWKLSPALLLTGFGAGLVFVPLFDFILGDATTDEVGTGAGMLNAVQQFAGAIGVAALGTVFFTRVGHPSTGSYFAAAELVFAIAAGRYLLTLLLVGLLPKHAQQPGG
jgi:hypothetical protein